jgi:hypothetical protein
MNNANLTAALQAAAAGGFVFAAIVTWNEATKKLDKRPAFSGWREAATTDPEQIKKMWTAFPGAVPGIELGRSNLFVVDLDRHHGGADGIANFEAFRASNPAPQCPTTKTPSGGYHLYFKQREGERLGNRTGTLPDGVDCRGDGGWTVAPGAVFKQWQWMGEPAKLAAAPPVPQWIVSAIQARKTAEYTAGPSPTDAGKRERAYAERALVNAADKVAASQRGRRNSELNTAAFCMGTMIARGWIGAATVEGRLHDAAAACGLLAEDGERTVRSTIKSGIEAGIKEPRGGLEDRNEGRAQTTRQPEPRDPAASPRSTSWREGLITARDLQTKTFAPVRIILPQLIPEGVTIVAGKPKIGKSWLSLDVCLAVAGDRFVLGEMKPVQGDVLYLALEDNERRLKKRVDKILQGVTAPEPLDIHTEWKRVDQGGLEDIEAWCKEHPKRRRLISIDTLAKIRPIVGRSEQAYAADYKAIEGLQKLAGEYRVAIVLNHHLRKRSSEDDAFDDVSGTLGLTGAADTIIVMKLRQHRHQHNHLLKKESPNLQ